MHDESLTEAKKSSDTVVVGWGRFNPPSTGHEKLIKRIATEAKTRKADYVIFPTKSEDPKKNPLTFREKVKFMKQLFPKYAKNISSDAKVNTLFRAAEELSKSGYTTFVLVVGSDRVQEFQRLLNQYNGKDYDFEKIEIVSAGDRDPDAKGVEGMSASKLRKAAADGDFKSFKKGISVAKVAKPLYNAVRKGMQVNERFEKEGIFDMLAEEANFTGPRFNRMLRFGLSSGGTGDIPLTKRAFKDLHKSGTNILLRAKVFSTIDRAFEFILEDDVLYNRFLMLLHRNDIFNEGVMDNEFELFLAEDAETEPVNFVASFSHPDQCKMFVQEAQDSGAANITWVSSEGMEIQFQCLEHTKISGLILNTQARVCMFDGDLLAGIPAPPTIDEAFDDAFGGE